METIQIQEVKEVTQPQGVEMQTNATPTPELTPEVTTPTAKEVYTYEINAKLLKEVVAGINSMVTEAVLEFNAEGVKVRQMDPSYVSMITALIPKAAFYVYDGDTDKVGVNLDDLKLILSNFSDEARLKIETKRKETSRVYITDTATNQYSSFPIVDMESNAPIENKVEKIEFEAITPLLVKDALNEMKKLNKVSVNVKVTTTDKTTFNASGDAGEYTTSTFEVESHAPDTQNVQLSLKYLIDFLKGLNKKETIRLYTKTNAPAKLELNKKGNYGADDYTLIMYLAPRIESC
jgi:DNA polymerase III sliding clamp (beta) subunit (PCNA family)